MFHSIFQDLHICGGKDNDEDLPESEMETAINKFKPVKPVVECFACKTAMFFIKEKMAFNGTAAKLANIVDQICLNAPPTFSSMCWTMKAKYMDVLLNYIESSETPTQICAVSCFKLVFRLMIQKHTHTHKEKMEHKNDSKFVFFF